MIAQHQKIGNLIILKNKKTKRKFNLNKSGISEEKDKEINKNSKNQQ